MEKNVRVIIPAAGKGSRLHCADIPKAMHRICDRPLIDIVLENTSFISPENTYIIVGYKKEKIVEFYGNKYNYVFQNEQFGTGHAVMLCSDAFKDFDGTVLITFGDMPLFRKEILKKLCEHHKRTGAACTLLTAIDPKRNDWAHILRGNNGEFISIIEYYDATPEQLRANELFAGALVFDSKALFDVLPLMSCSNALNEYYLTEVPEILAKHGLKIETLATDDNNDLCGVNTPEDMVICEAVYKERMGID